MNAQNADEGQAVYDWMKIARGEPTDNQVSSVSEAYKAGNETSALSPVPFLPLL